MSDSDIEVNLRSIRSEGVTISKSQLFDTSILDEAYNGQTHI